MPRRKANDRTGPVKTRSREGCSECRASRVRCDTKKPACTRCQERGLTCSTKVVLKWESEFASRGQAFGRAGVWSKSKAAGNLSTSPPSSSNAFSLREQEWCLIPRVEAWNFINSLTDAFRQPYQVTPTEDDHALISARRNRMKSSSSYELGLSTIQLAAPLPSLSVLPQFSGSIRGHLFEYYVQRICPRTIASANTPSPLASIIIPFSTTASDTVSNAILALGACALSLDDPKYCALGLRLKSEALKGLRYRLTAPGSLVSTSDPEILVVMMLLCLYELVDHCDQRWIVHLKGAKELIRFRRQQATWTDRQQEEVTSFAERFFAFQDIMGRTACGEQPLFGTDYWQHNERKIDPWMGCSPELVSILSDITELSRTRRQLASNSDQAVLSTKSATLCRQLEELIQDVDEEDVALQAIAEMKRLAAVLYLHCALNNASPTTPLVVDYVRKILRLVSDMLDTGTYVGLAWPVFVAAVELDPLNDELWRDANGDEVCGRPLVLRALAAMSEYNILSVARTRAVIVKVWQVRDNVLTPSLGDASDNDWECYVAPFSNAMSLA